MIFPREVVQNYSQQCVLWNEWMNDRVMLFFSKLLTVTIICNHKQVNKSRNKLSKWHKEMDVSARKAKMYGKFLHIFWELFKHSTLSTATDEYRAILESCQIAKRKWMDACIYNKCFDFFIWYPNRCGAFSVVLLKYDEMISFDCNLICSISNWV